MINVSEVVLDPAFSQTISITRTTGSFVKGRFVGTTSSFNVVGTLTVNNPKDIVQTPEADRITGSINFFSVTQLYTTRDTLTTDGISDIITWKGEKYKILSSIPWGDFGYYQSTAIRMAGA